MVVGVDDLCNVRDKICQITSDTFLKSYLRNGNGIALVYENKNTALLQKG